MKTRKLVHGVGINDADYAVVEFETIGYADGKRKQKLVWFCPYYRAWTSMLKRCYSIKSQERQPTYKGCSVTDEWLTFSNFKSWMENSSGKTSILIKTYYSKGIKFIAQRHAFSCLEW